jgi:hypothetical protein
MLLYIIVVLTMRVRLTEVGIRMTKTSDVIVQRCDPEGRELKQNPRVALDLELKQNSDHTPISTEFLPGPSSISSI